MDAPRITCLFHDAPTVTSFLQTVEGRAFGGDLLVECSSVPALGLVSVSAVVEAAEAKATRWSDRATWPNKKVPVAGDKVIIEKDKQVVLDVTPPAPVPVEPPPSA